ncbi:MAG: EF-hand domain-containing protein [Sphingomonadales bacterium]
MKRTIIMLAASFALGSAAFAAGDMKDKDADGNGSISKAEHDAAVKAGWTEKDADGDGMLSKAEQGDKAGKMADADTDKDGSISAAEYTAKKEAWFKKADSDGDGAISQAEYDAAKAAKKN